jgi:hypothetical protein
MVDWLCVFSFFFLFCIPAVTRALDTAKDVHVAVETNKQKDRKKAVISFSFFHLEMKSPGESVNSERSAFVTVDLCCVFFLACISVALFSL